MSQILHLQNGLSQRISGKLLKQLGGARTTQEIDQDFDNPNIKIPLTWAERNDSSDYASNGRAERWDLAEDNWYNFLQISTDYIVEKCRAAGITEPDLLEILEIWGNKIHDMPVVRPPNPDENLATKPTPNGPPYKYMKDLPDGVKRAIEDYTATVLKDREKHAYQTCSLKTRKNKLHQWERSECHNLMCRYGHEVTDEFSLAHELDIATPETARQLLRCAELGEFCNSVSGLPQTFDRSRFRHLKNSGKGDCLFVAVAHYMLLGDRLRDAIGAADTVYPTIELLDAGAYNDANETPYQVTPEKLGSRRLIETGEQLRAQVVQWARDHPDYMSAGNTLKRDLAILYVEEGEGLLDTRTYWVSLKSYFSKNRTIGDGKLFQMVKNRKDDRARLVRIIVESENYLKEHPDHEQAHEHLMDFLFDQYLVGMSDVHTYGGSPEVVILSQILQINLIVTQSGGPNQPLIAVMGGPVRGTDEYMIIYETGHRHYEIMYPEQLLTPEPKKTKPAGTLKLNLTIKSNNSVLKIAKGILEVADVKTPATVPMISKKLAEVNIIPEDKMLPVLDYLVADKCDALLKVIHTKSKLSGPIMTIFKKGMEVLLEKNVDGFAAVVYKLAGGLETDEIGTDLETELQDLFHTYYQQIPIIQEIHLSRQGNFPNEIDGDDAEEKLENVWVDLFDEPSGAGSLHELLDQYVTVNEEDSINEYGDLVKDIYMQYIIYPYAGAAVTSGADLHLPGLNGVGVELSDFRDCHYKTFVDIFSSPNNDPFDNFTPEQMIVYQQIYQVYPSIIDNGLFTQDHLDGIMGTLLSIGMSYDDIDPGILKDIVISETSQ